MTLAMLADHPKRIYFAGIAGTAMASLAVLLKHRGYQISGSDSNIYPPMSTFIEENEIQIFQGYHQQNLQNPPDLVVIGNALSRGNPEVEEILSQGIPYISMAELLKTFFIQGRESIVVSGTHGKTTTTSLVAWILEEAGLSPGFMIGGIAENFHTSCQEGAGKLFITEGDEYDTAFFDKRSKFFHYLPNQLIINNIEFDHADIFSSLEAILQSFQYLLRLVPSSGVVIANGDDENVNQVIQHAYSKVITFGMGKHCDLYAQKIEFTTEGTHCHLFWEKYGDLEFFIPLFGEHNVRNAMAAIIVGLHNGLSPAIIQKGLSSFLSVKRRLELRGTVKGIEVYDDFAHHPTAIQETIHALRQKIPERRILAVFEPRSNTSVGKTHQEKLASAFAQADDVLLALPHRIETLPVDDRLNVAQVVAEIRHNRKQASSFSSVEEIINYLKKHAQPKDRILIMSNGKFENIHQRLLEALSHR